MRSLTWLLTLPLTLIVVSFAVSNLVGVEIGLWPLPWRLEVPAFLLVLGAFLFGFVCGGAVMWWSGRRQRRAVRQERTRADQAEKALQAAKGETTNGETAKGATAKPEASTLPVRAA